MSDEAGGLIRYDDGRWGCWWAGDDREYRAYHDSEWGRPVDDDIRLFEKLCLEGFQTGLSWLTILRKRKNFREAFAGFDPAVIAGFGPDDVERLLDDAGIVRHRGKIEATINNARRYHELVDTEGSLAAFVWQFEPDEESRPIEMTRDELFEMTKTPESTRLSKELKRKGWRFVGPTTMYAFMQAMGLVNDHLEGCHVRAEALAERAAFTPPS